MAIHTFNAALPANTDPANVPRTAGGTISAGSVQVQIDDSVSRTEIYNLLGAVQNKIARGDWPPTGA